ncbi:hypothetical protein VYU27_009092 [Nannochloropsis oceanica]
MQNHDMFKRDRVGISFAIKRQLFESGLWFEPSQTEDFDLLKRIFESDYDMVISPYVMYYVRNEYAVGLQVVDGVLGIASFTAWPSITSRDIQRVTGERAADIKLAAAEIKRIEGERAADIRLAAAQIKRIESERKLSEKRWRAEVEKYKHDLQLKHTEDCKPYQAAKEQANKERGGTGGREKEEGTN